MLTGEGTAVHPRLLVAGAAAAFFGARTVIPALVEWRIAAALGPDVELRDAGVSVALGRGAILARGVVLRTGGPGPRLTVEEVSLAIDGDALWHGRLRARLSLRSPCLVLHADALPRDTRLLQDAATALLAALPGTVDRVRIDGGRLLVADANRPGAGLLIQDLWLDASAGVGGGGPEEPLPARIAVSGRPLGAGLLLVRAELDPLAAPPRFRLDARLADVRLAPLSPFVGPTARGRLDAHVEMEGGDGRLRGYIAPSFAPGNAEAGSVVLAEALPAGSQAGELVARRLLDALLPVIRAAPQSAGR
jgi:hypothetical protein